MPIDKYIEINGFELVLTTLHSGTEVVVNIGNEKISQAIRERDPAFLNALDSLVQAYDEIDSVMLAEESFSMWLQSSYAVNKQTEFYIILNSEFASDKLKQQVRKELGYITSPTPNASPQEWYAMMYGVYQAMPDEEKQALHNWEQNYVDGSGRFATSDWPGWEKYIGKMSTSIQKSQRKKRKGFIYLVRAETGEFKIGYSVDVENRIKAFSVQPPFEYELIHTFSTDDMERAESILHDKFSAKRIKGEWFSLDIEDVNEIIQIKAFENGHFLTGAG